MKADIEKAPWAIGLMSGTSLDGVDAALLQTDGERVTARGEWLTLPYDADFQHEIRAVIAGEAEEAPLSRALAEKHAEAVQALLARSGMKREEIQVVGFHGQTVLHAPERRITRQIGDGALLARLTGIDVVADFRWADVEAGGQGAPLVPLYHAALAESLPKPVALLNIGGVGNVTWIGADGALLALDTGPGCALINDLVHTETGAEFDRDGALAREGRVDEAAAARFLADPFFAHIPPKSLDRNHFRALAAECLAGSRRLADRVATLTRITAECVAAAQAHFPASPKAWYVCGGGRLNPALMDALADCLHAPVASVEALGLEGDALEAQAFGFLAVRSLRGLPLSLPSTTGVPEPMCGGTHYSARAEKKEKTG